MALTLKNPKKYLEQEAIRRGIRLSSVNDVKELYESEQLALRNYWKQIDYPELSQKIAYPGQLLISNEMEAGTRNKAPNIGEHNTQIFEKELGYSKEKIMDMMQRGII
jgi:formyl-CoA transferase